MLILLLLASLQASAGDWPVYGHDAGGARFSPLTRITRGNVARLQVAWTYHAGIPDMSSMSHRPPPLVARYAQTPPHPLPHPAP